MLRRRTVSWYPCQTSMHQLDEGLAVSCLVEFFPTTIEGDPPLNHELREYSSPGLEELLHYKMVSIGSWVLHILLKLRFRHQLVNDCAATPDVGPVPDSATQRRPSHRIKLFLRSCQYMIEDGYKIAWTQNMTYWGHVSIGRTPLSVADPMWSM